VVFADRSVSRLHARILENKGEYRIYEEGSSSGTYVNFERLGLAPRTLQDMDRIHLGRVHLRFHLASSLMDAASQDEGLDTQVGIPGI
jgi:predicted component of type VI protein secretion system